MFKRILVAYDGSDLASAALDFSLHLATQMKTGIVLAHVVELPGDDEVIDPGDHLLAALFGEGQERWRARLAGLRAGAPAGIDIETRVRVGRVADELLDVVAQEGIDLVVAGTHGVGGLKRVLLGSVSQRLLECAPCSVLFFRSPLPEGAHPKVLVGLDGSTDAERALATAESLAAALDTGLVLVHVADYHIPFANGGHQKALRDLLRRHGQQLLHDARRTLAAPLDVVIDDLREGDVREQMLTACEEHAPVIAVVGTRGMHGFRGLFLGSVARDLVNYTSAPALVVRSPRPTDAQTVGSQGEASAVSSDPGP